MQDNENNNPNLRDLSCLLRCSLLLKALLQNWHLYFFSGASDDFLMADDDAVLESTVVMFATGIFGFRLWWVMAAANALSLPLPHRSMVEIVCLASVGVRFKVCLDCFDM
jgi:hypothetical protein